MTRRSPGGGLTSSMMKDFPIIHSCEKAWWGQGADGRPDWSSLSRLAAERRNNLSHGRQSVEMCSRDVPVPEGRHNLCGIYAVPPGLDYLAGTNPRVLPVAIVVSPLRGGGYPNGFPSSAFLPS